MPTQVKGDIASSPPFNFQVVDTLVDSMHPNDIIVNMGANKRGQSVSVRQQSNRRAECITTSANQSTIFQNNISFVARVLALYHFRLPRAQSC